LINLIICIASRFNYVGKERVGWDLKIQIQTCLPKAGAKTKAKRGGKFKYKPAGRRRVQKLMNPSDQPACSQQTGAVGQAQTPIIKYTTFCLLPTAYWLLHTAY